jgi:hypothetical protein
LGRLLLGSTAYTTSNGSITNTGNSGGYTLATGGTGVLLQSPTSGGVVAGSNSGYLNFTLPATAGPINGSLTLTNTGNGSDPSNHTMTVAGAVVADRPLSITQLSTLLPGNGRVYVGTTIDLSLGDAGNGADNANTMPNVLHLTSNLPAANGVTANAVSTGVISHGSNTAPIRLTYATAGTYSTSGTINLVGGGILTHETNLIGAGNPPEVPISVPAVNIVQSRPLTVGAVGLANTNVLTGSLLTTTVGGGVYSDALYTMPTLSTTPTGVSGVTLSSSGGTISNSVSGTVQIQYGTNGLAGGNVDLVAAGVVKPEGVYTNSGYQGVTELVNQGSPLNFSVPVANVGLGTAVGGNYGIQLTGSGPSSGTVMNASLGSTLTFANGSQRAAGSQATIFGLGMTNVSMKWRQATSTDIAGLPSGTNGFASDVANVSSVSGALALQMKYDSSLFGDGGAAAGAAGKLFLGYLNGGAWANAGSAGVSYNKGNEPLATLLGNSTSLGTFVGDWGYDTTSHTVWAVLGSLASSTDFAVPATIPEPSTLALLAAGIAAGLVWRRKRA